WGSWRWRALTEVAPEGRAYAPKGRKGQLPPPPGGGEHTAWTPGATLSNPSEMAIGVFDSGVGGLTVHHKLVERFPTADFVYLADQANAPYGGRPGEEIVDLTRAG